MKILETHIVPAIEEDIRLQEYAPGIFNSVVTKSALKKAIKRQEILIDGKVAKTSDWVRENQRIELLQQEIVPKKIFQLKLEVIFEDEYMAVINKPAGYPTSGNYFRTIENALSYNLKASAQADALPHPAPVHRLDNPTSGLLIVAKTRKAQTVLHRDFKNKKIQKIYTAVVHGKTPETAVINAEIDKKPALTKIRTLEMFSENNEIFSLIEAYPETGRTHQIRLHLAEKGFPIVGDKEYGPGTQPFRKKGMNLAATGLSLMHPVKSEQMSFKADFPKKYTGSES